MASVVFNISLGRVLQRYEFVESNSVAAAELVVIPVDIGATTIATIRDFDTVAAVLGGGVTERTAGNWDRKIFTETELAAVPAPDDPNDDIELTLPQMTWAAILLADGATTHLMVAYDAAGTGVDANTVPMCLMDFAITPDGSDVTANTGPFWRSTSVAA